MNRKLRFVSLLAVLLGIPASVLINILTGENNVKDLIAGIGTKGLVAVFIVISVLQLLAKYLELHYEQSPNQATGTKISVDEFEENVHKFFNTLKERYQKRYDQKLDGRFEITLEVSENFDDTEKVEIKERFGKNPSSGQAIVLISRAFKEKGRLLIVGSPGAGKTVLLLKLACNLFKTIDEKNEKGQENKGERGTRFRIKEPFPVMFNLATWSEDYEKFEDWLIAMLVSGNGLSEDFAAGLLEQGRIVLLLDGLDELARNEDEITAGRKRAACLESLNNDRSLKRGQKVVICCRDDEFVQMQRATGKDAPVSAKISIGDLTREQIEDAILEALDREVDGKKIDQAAANNLMGFLDNEVFLKVLRTPFYFTTALEVFDQHFLEERDIPKEQDDLEKYLIEKWVEAKLKSTKPKMFEPAKTRGWLKGLALLLKKREQVTFELTDLQTAELSNRWVHSLLFGLISGLVVGSVVGLVFGLIDGLFGGGVVLGLVKGLGAGLIAGLSLGVYAGLFGAIVFGLENRTESKSVGQSISSKLLNWSYWKKSLAFGASVGLVNGLLGALFISLVGFFSFDSFLLPSDVNSFPLRLFILLLTILLFALFFGLYCAFTSSLMVGLFCGLVGRLEDRLKEDNVQPHTSNLLNWRYWIKVLIISSVLGLFIGSIHHNFIIGWLGTFFSGLLGGLFLGLIFDLDPEFQTRNAGQLDFTRVLNWRYWVKVLIASLTLGLVCCGFIVRDGVPIGFSMGVFIGLFAGAFFGLAGGLEGEIKAEDIVHLDFTKLLDWRGWLKVLAISLVLGFIFSFTFTWIGGLFIALLYGLFGVFENLKSITKFARLEYPYQRIKGGMKINLALMVLILLLTIGVMLFLHSSKTDALSMKLLWVSTLLSFFLFLPLIRQALFRHSILRLALYLEHKMPLKYVTFLTYGAKTGVLEEEGGQWRFRHQNLQDYFANQL